MSSLADRHCTALQSDSPALDASQTKMLMELLHPDWQIETNLLNRDFLFKNFHETMAFVNAIAWVAHQENHHPDFEVGYKHCLIQYTTHSIGGLSENDFICAAKIDRLL
jgi:4a-hydroxytetrahydrobiopterin dehydratase